MSFFQFQLSARFLDAVHDHQSPEKVLAFLNEWAEKTPH
jgi:hypothetical protein